MGYCSIPEKDQGRCEKWKTVIFNLWGGGGVLLLGSPQHSVPTLTELRALEDSLVESIRNLEPMYHAAVADEDMEKVFELLSHHYVFYFVLVLYFWEKLF